MPIMTTVTAYERTMRAARADVLRVRKQADSQITAAYRRLQAHIAAPLDALQTAYARALAAKQKELDAAAADAGETADAARLPVAWLTTGHAAPFPHLRVTVASAASQLASEAHMATLAAQHDAAGIGGRDAQSMLRAAVAPIAHLLPHQGHIFILPNDAAVRAFVGRAKNGSPLSDLFASFGPDAATALHDTLAAGLVAGIGPRQLASEAARTIQTLTYSRASTIMRTEVIHAWHTAALENYRANSDVVSGWIWMADKGSACAACLAMDGTILDLDQDIDDHPNGKCARGPVTKSYSDILSSYGIDTSGDDLADPPWTQYQSGADWLDEQDAATQRQVFGGQAAYNAYTSGDADLSDFATVRDGGAWGQSVQQASLRSMGLDAADYSDG